MLSNQRIGLLQWGAVGAGFDDALAVRKAGDADVQEGAEREAEEEGGNGEEPEGGHGSSIGCAWASSV